MGDTKRDLVDEINEELDNYNRRYDDGMTHEEGQDFARSWHAVLNGAAIEIAGLRAERDAALAEVATLLKLISAESVLGKHIVVAEAAEALVRVIEGFGWDTGRACRTALRDADYLKETT